MMVTEISRCGFSCIDSGGSAAMQPTVWLRFTETSRVPPTARLELDWEVLQCVSIIAFKMGSPFHLLDYKRNTGIKVSVRSVTCGRRLCS